MRNPRSSSMTRIRSSGGSRGEGARRDRRRRRNCGSLLPHELRRAGLRVIVLDEHGAGQGATAAGMGHIVVMDDSEASVRAVPVLSAAMD